MCITTFLSERPLNRRMLILLRSLRCIKCATPVVCITIASIFGTQWTKRLQRCQISVSATSPLTSRSIWRKQRWAYTNSHRSSFKLIQIKPGSFSTCPTVTHMTGYSWNTALFVWKTISIAVSSHFVGTILTCQCLVYSHWWASVTTKFSCQAKLFV